MSNTITTTLQINGSRNFTAVIDITGDGSAQESNTVILALSSLTGAPSAVKVKSVNWDLTDFSAALKGSTSPSQALALPVYGDEMDFFEMGAPRLFTGDIQLDTFGLTAASRGTIVINGYHD